MGGLKGVTAPWAGHAWRDLEPPLLASRPAASRVAGAAETPPAPPHVPPLTRRPSPGALRGAHACRGAAGGGGLRSRVWGRMGPAWRGPFLTNRCERSRRGLPGRFSARVSKGIRGPALPECLPGGDTRFAFLLPSTERVFTEPGRRRYCWVYLYLACQ